MDVYVILRVIVMIDMVAMTGMVILIVILWLMFLVDHRLSHPHFTIPIILFSINLFIIISIQLNRLIFFQSLI
jgi:hypothetical protein